MALILKAAITATQTTLDVLGSDALSEGDIRQVDSEQLMVRSVMGPALAYLETTYRRLSVFRGVAGTTKAAHAANSSLTTLTVTDQGSGVAGVGLLTYRIGPFHIDKDTPNVNSDVIVLSDALPDGSVVLEAWALFPVGWKSNTNADCDFKLELASYPTPYFTAVLKEYPAPGTGAFSVSEPAPITTGVQHQHDGGSHNHVIPAGTDAAGGATDSSNAGPTANTTSLTSTRLGIVDYAAWSVVTDPDTVTSIQLACEVYANSGASITQGEADIYAIIATPAS